MVRCASVITLRATNFRVLAHINWRPAGVCLLAGPNGAGKTTILDLLQFLRNLFQRGHEAAFSAIGGQYIQRRGTPADEPVVFELQVDDIRWQLRFPLANHGLRGTYGEELWHGDELICRASMFDDGWFLGDRRIDRSIDDQRPSAKIVWDRGEAGWMKPLVDTINGMRVYSAYWLNQVRQPGPDMPQAYLHGTGANLWSVLHNWQGSPLRYRGQFEWVMQQARLAFPGVIDKLEFDRNEPFLFGPGASVEDGLPPTRAADGVLTALLHLTAIAGAPDGGIVAFDEMENQLHPHAIRTILAAMRAQADQRNLTVILTTHSPVLMNAFRNDLERFYVLELSNHGQPKAINELHDEVWLAQSFLGELYENLEFASPRGR